MHQSKILLVLLCCLYTTINSGQIKLDSIGQVLVKKNEYFGLERELIHIHTNKTLYLTNEAIWFKAYIVDNLNHKPFTVTKNLYVTLYDQNGFKIDHKLYLASNGYADGAFIIPKDLNTGNYILMASTAHQDNFKEDERYYQKITIKNVSQPIRSEIIEEQQKTYDIQILPEGGNLLAGIMNTCGVKIIDQKGLGVQEVNAKLFSQNSKDPITEFKLNKFGMGKFSFNPSPNEQYYVISTIGNVAIKTAVPKPKRKGVLLTSNLHPSKPLLMVALHTNEATLPTIKNKPFHILIHQYQKTTGLSVSYTDETSTMKLAISLEDLPYGTNTISLFDEAYNPISERLIFNDIPNKRITSSEEIKSIRKKDSIVTSFRLKSNNGFVKNASVSVSVLPVETIANTNNESIINSLYLQPFIQSHVENPGYYFQNVTKRKKYDLDLLLLTQGWSKYDWNSIFRNNTLPRVAHEDGLKLKGAVNKTNTENAKLFIHSKENDFLEIIPSTKNKPLTHFSFDNIILKDSSKVHFAIIDKKNQVLNANVKTRLESFKPIIFNREILNINTASSNQNNAMNSASNWSINESFFKEGEQLEKVVITKKLNKNRGAYWATPHEAYIPEDMRESRSVLNYLNLRRIRIAINNASYGVKQGNILDFDSVFQKEYIKGIQRFGFFVNGVKTSPQIASAIPLKEVVAFYLFEAVGGGGSISVYWYPQAKDQTPLDALIITDGYQPKKHFYTPKYESYDSLFFKQYGAIGWTPTVKRNINNEYEFSFKNTLAHEAKLFIEGIDPDGNLISEIKIIQIPNMP